MQATDQLPNPARGEVVVTLGGAVRRLRFSTNVLRDYSQLTGHTADNIGHDIASNFTETLPTLVLCALRRFVPAAELPSDLMLDTVVDWLDELSQEDAELLSEALLSSIRTGNPLVAATVKKLIVAATDLQQKTQPEA